VSAAANAAGYLYAHGYLAASNLDEQGNVERSPEPKPVPKPVRTPRIEYRKRRAYALPA
jgi:hypothetical protein